jgi:hypothetical protein
LIEAIILFSKAEKRSEVIDRINDIFLEEKASYKISKNIIIKNEGEDLGAIKNQIADDKLRFKISSFYKFYQIKDYINAAKISAEIVGIIYSDDSNDKKSTIDNIYESLADSVVVNGKESEKRKKEFKKVLQEYSRVANSLNNRIYDVRHSEKDRVKISNDFIYKLIALQNMSIVEFTITSLKSDYIESEESELIKKAYIENFKIDPKVSRYIPDADDIPF